MRQVPPFIDFQGKTVMVTGASSGIGKAIAVELGRRNAFTVLLGRNVVNLEKTACDIGNNCCKIVEFDLLRIDQIADAVRRFAKEHGPIYGISHAAGVVETRPLASFRMDSFRGMMDVNCAAGIELAKAACRRDVMESDGGAVVFISSIYGHIGMAGQIGYSATKGAILSAAKAMAVELARRNIRVNTISPGLVVTPMTDEAMTKLPSGHFEQLKQLHPLGIGTPEDVARAAVFLLAPENRWVTGIDFIIDGGYTAA